MMSTEVTGNQLEDGWFWRIQDCFTLVSSTLAGMPEKLGLAETINQRSMLEPLQHGDLNIVRLVSDKNAGGSQREYSKKQ